ncbi:MAG: DUF349 domain-containing protein [Bacteroidales bacterium]|nr:DUF349 domain-containing protein [Bacteroidales bacterium]MDY0215783.1 DUF349 domain-containing protein [Bacteroidales bacterium]
MENKINSNPVSDEHVESNQNNNAEISNEEKTVEPETEKANENTDALALSSVENKEKEVTLPEVTEDLKEAIDTPEDLPLSKEEKEVALPEIKQDSEKAKKGENNDADLQNMMGEIDNLSDENSDNENEEEEEDSLEEKVEIDLSGIDEKTPAELVNLFNEILQKYKIQQIKSNISTIRSAFRSKINANKQIALDAFIAEGGEKDDFNLEESNEEIMFNELLKTYRERKQSYIESLEKQKIENLIQKKKLLEELKLLIESTEPLKIINDKFREIDEKWKTIGQVPQKEITSIWKNYHFYVERFFDKVRMYRELKDLDLKKNLELKIELCEKAEQLLVETSLAKSFKLLQQYHDQWKEIGPVPEDKKDEIWERFKNSTDRINEHRREYYENRQEELQNNYKAKLVLCEQAEELCNKDYGLIKEWNKVSEELAELLKIWKTIGPAPKEFNDQVWEKFKGSMDIFFTNKKRYLQKIKDEQLENYNRKVHLCIQAESIAERTDWRKATNELLQLQKEWKEIGIVSRKQSEQIWKRFRAACDDFFARKSAYFSNAKESEQENLVKKTDLIERIKTFEYTESRNDDFEQLKAFQREWNEIGHVPIKEKERLYTEYKTALDAHFEKLKVSSGEMRKSRYNAKLESIMDSPNSDRVIEKERRFLMGKANQLKEDIQLWENNIGFFSKSKNAQLLAAEFTKKIEDARKELSDIEDKLKLLTGKN